jgi:hypothetical protein
MAMQMSIGKPIPWVAIERADDARISARLVTISASFLVAGLALALAGTAFIPGVLGAEMAIAGAFTAIAAAFLFGCSLWVRYAGPVGHFT